MRANKISSISRIMYIDTFMVCPCVHKKSFSSSEYTIYLHSNWYVVLETSDSDSEIFEVEEDIQYFLPRKKTSYCSGAPQAS